MKKVKFQSIDSAKFGKLSNEGMNAMKGGYTLPSVTVTPEKPGVPDKPTSNKPDDGDDAFMND